MYKQIDLYEKLMYLSTFETLMSRNKVASKLHNSLIAPPNVCTYLLTKGQLISKGLVGILNSFKKRTKRSDLQVMMPQVDLFSFVFWKN